MNEVTVFEVITIDGAIEKADSRELITYDELRQLNDEFIEFLVDRGYGFGGIMSGVKPKGRRES